MIERFKKWLAPPVFPGDEEKTTQASLMNRVGLFYALMLLIAEVIFVPFFSNHQLESSAAILLLQAVYILSRWLLFRGRVKLSGGLIAGAAWLVCMLASYLGGGISSPFMFAVLAATVIVGLLLDRRADVFFILSTILIWLGFASFQQSGLALPGFVVFTPISTWFLFSMVLIFIEGLTHLILYNLSGALAASRQQAKALFAAETSLRESESRFRGLFENAPTGMFHVLPDLPGKSWRFLRANPALARILGYGSPAEFISSINELAFPLFADPQQPQKISDLVLQQDGWYSQEIALRRKDGSTLLAQFSARKVLDPDGSLTCLEGFLEDIGPRKLAEQTLRQDAERLNLILEAGSDGVWDFDIPSDAILFSPGYTRSLGYEPEEYAHNNAEWESMVHPDDLAGLNQVFADAIDRNVNFSHEFRLREKSGRWHWVLSRGVVIERDSQGRALRMVGTHTDIQQLKQSAEALSESQAALNAIINSTADLIWSVDSETFAIQTFNQGLSDHFMKWLGVMIRPGMTLEQMLGQPEYVAVWQALYRRVLRDGAYTTEYGTFSGTAILDLSFNLLKRGGAVFGISVFARDVTQLKQAEAALRESETRYRSITENSMAGIYIIQDGLLTYVNTALADMMGYSAEELTGVDPLRVIHPDDHDRVRENLRRRMAGEIDSIHYEFRSLARDGSSRICEAMGVRIELQDRPAIMGTILDITERKQAEQANQRRSAELTALNEIGKALSKLVESSEIFEQLFTILGRVLDNSNLYIAVYDEASQFISFPVYTMRGQRLEGGGRPLADGITDYIIRNNQSLLVKNDMDAYFEELGIQLIGTPSRSFLAVPINTEQHVLGVIALQDYEHEHIYDEHHLELLTTIAAQVSVALENARLFHAAQESEARFRAVVENNHDGIVMMSAERRVLYASPSYYRISGYLPEEWQDAFGPDYIHPQDQARVSELFNALVQHPGAVGSLEYRLRHKDGHWFWVETTAANLLEEPDVCAMVLNSHDISERKRAEAALRESEERYRLLNDHSPNAVVVHNQAIIEFVNPACIKLLGGVSPDDFIGRNVFDFIHPDKFAVARERSRMVNEENQVAPLIESIYVRLDGQPVSVETTAVPFIYQGHKAVLSTITDISGRKRAEEALHESEERYRLLVDHSPNTIIVHSGGKIEFINEAGVKMMGGTSPADFIGKDALSFVEPAGRARVLERMQAAYLEDRPGVAIESVYIRLDGQPVHVETSTVPFIFQGHKAVLGTITDISERKRAEEALRSHNAHLQALQETSFDLVSQLDLPTLLENIVKRAGQLVGTNSGYLDLVEPGSSHLVSVVGLGLLADPDISYVLAGEGVSGLVWRTRQPVVVDDYDNWPDRNVGFKPGLIRAVIAMPLSVKMSETGAHSDAGMLGVLGLAYGAETDHTFGEEDIRLLSDFARLAVLAIRNARLYQRATQELGKRKLAQIRLKKRAGQLTLLKDIGQKIAGVLDPHGVLELAARLVHESLGYHHVALFTIDEENRQLVMRGRAGKFNRLFPPDHRVMIGEGMVGYVVRTGRRLLARDVSKERRYRNYYPDVIPTQSELSLPLKVGGRVVGVLDVQSPQLNAFGDDDLNVLETVADEVAVALENASLYASVQTELAERLRVEAELINYRDNLENMVRERTAQLEIAVREAEAANQAKSDFLAVMSHEIRTPLNGVLGLTHLALQTSLNEKQHEYLSRVEDSGELLLAIINDILDFSKIESGKLDLDRADFDLDEILHNLSNVLSYQVQQKELELVYDVAQDVPRRLVGDPQRLRQVLLNLTGNAVKFTERGSVVLKISLGRNNPGNDPENNSQHILLDFSVTDTGIGMTPAQVAGLFQPFSQVDSSTSRKYGGTGLGLAISQRLVNLMGGEINVRSVFGSGTVFNFSLAFEHQQRVDEPALVAPQNMSGLRIMVLDSSPILLDFIKTTLESFSYSVAAFLSQDAFVEAFPAETLPAGPLQPLEFDLLLVDWKLDGEVTGLETARQLRKHPSLAHAHVILMVNSQEIFRHYESDLDGFLFKPVTRSRLFDAVMSIFGQSPNHSLAAGTQLADLHADTHALSGRHVLVVEDNSINQMVARDMLQSMGLTVSLADSGEMALEILEVERFDAVLMDIQMPGMDGYETTKQIRANPRFAEPRLPVIAMTAHAMTSDRDKASHAGLDDFVSKPVSINELAAALLRWLPPLKTPAETGPVETSPVVSNPVPGSGLKNAAVPAPADAGLPPQVLACLNTSAAINRLGGDINLYRRILGLFRAEHSNMLEEIQTAVLAADSSTARSRAHSLKGLAGTLGADEIMALTRQLETAILAGDQPQVQDCLSDLQPRFAALISALELL